MKNLAGTVAYSFNLPDTNGIFHQLADFSGSWLLMVFHRHLG